MLAAGATRDEFQVERVVLRIQANQEEPHGATADFDLVRLENAVEDGSGALDALPAVSSSWRTIPPEMMVFNPMGIIITYLRGDRALVTGG